MNRICKKISAVIAVLVMMVCGAAAAEKTTAAWIPGSDCLTTDRTDDLKAMTSWIANQAEAGKISMVLHTGSMVSDYGDEKQWQAADEAYSRIGEIVAQTYVPGKNDIGISNNDYSFWLTWFGRSRQKTRDDVVWFKNGEANAQFLTVGEKKIMILSLGYGMSSSMLHWADELLCQYPDVPVIITANRVIRDGKKLSSAGVKLFSSIVSLHTNVRMVLCSDGQEDGIRYDFFDDNSDGIQDRRVVTLLNCQYFPQTEENSLCDFARFEMMDFDEDAGTLTINTMAIDGGEVEAHAAGVSFELEIADWF